MGVCVLVCVCLYAKAFLQVYASFICISQCMIGYISQAFISPKYKWTCPFVVCKIVYACVVLCLHIDINYECMFCVYVCMIVCSAWCIFREYVKHFLSVFLIKYE